MDKIGMDASVRERWLSALRSGEYKQGRYKLRRHYVGTAEHELSYCCLGVLCDLVEPDGWGIDDDKLHHHNEYEFPRVELSQKIFKAGDLNQVDAAKFMQELTKLNDYNTDLGFDSIADYIEQNTYGLE